MSSESNRAHRVLTQRQQELILQRLNERLRNGGRGVPLYEFCRSVSQELDGVNLKAVRRFVRSFFKKNTVVRRKLKTGTRASATNRRLFQGRVNRAR